MFRNYIRTRANRSSASRAARPRHPVRPSLERLEERWIPTVTYHGGLLLQNVDVIPIFYGQAWSDPANAPIITKVGNFLKYIVNSSYMDMLGEYSTQQTHLLNPPQQRSVLDQFFGAITGQVDYTDLRTATTGFKIGRGSARDGEVFADVTAPKKAAKITQSDIEAHLKSASDDSLSLIDIGRKYSPTVNTLYMVFTAPGSSVYNQANQLLNPSSSTSSTTSFHSTIDLGSQNIGIYYNHDVLPSSNNFYYDKGKGTPWLVPYAIMPFPQNNSSGVLDELTSAASHELAEAVTDPITPDHADVAKNSLLVGWYDDHPDKFQPPHKVNDDEIGDFCEGDLGGYGPAHYGRLNGYYVQSEYSNQQSMNGTKDGCRLPADASSEFYGDTISSALGLVNPVAESGSPILENWSNQLPDGSRVSASATPLPGGTAKVAFTVTNLPATTTFQGGSGVIMATDGTVLLQYTVGTPTKSSVSGTYTTTQAGQAAGYGIPAISQNTSSGETINGVIGSFIDTNPNANPQVTIAWGDGTTSPGGVQPDPTTPHKFNVSGSHNYGPTSQGKQYTVTLTVSDSSQQTTTILSTVHVTNQTAMFFAIGGAPGRVQVHKVQDGSLVTEFAPYGPSYTGGVSVAVGDVNGDGYPDLVTGATVGNPHVKVFDGKALATGTFDPNNPDASVLAQWFPYALQFNVGANVAVGNVENNGYADIVTGATVGNPDVRVYRGKDIASGTFHPDGSSMVAQWFAYGLQFNIGANVAVGDVNGDGFADVVTGATAGNPDVHVYSGKDITQGAFQPTGASLLAQWFAYGLQFNIGANVAVGDVNGDGFADVITGASAGNPDVRVFDGKAIAQGTFNPQVPTTSLLDHFFAYQLQFDIGVTVAAADFDGTGKAAIVTGASAGTPHYRVVRSDATGIEPPALNGFEGIPSSLQGGIAVGA